MKKVKFAGKLSLNKETIAKLNDEQLQGVMGGAITQTDRTCNTLPCNQTRITCDFTITGCVSKLCTVVVPSVGC